MHQSKLKAAFFNRLKKNSNLIEKLQRILRLLDPEKTIILDYPVISKRRWNENNPHPELYEIINSNRNIYAGYLNSFVKFLPLLAEIPEQNINGSSTEPCWKNGWMPALDGISLYAFVVLNHPKCYLEVGAGNSTRFVRQAIENHKLSTKIISIDPHPRVEIDRISDKIIKEPVENIDLGLFKTLAPGDILYIDNSHRTFMNSDVTTMLIDVIPKLNPGVLVQIHDILLPYDYPEEWIDRYYSEQYLLAAYLLARGKKFDIMLPNTFISNDVELHSILKPFWKNKAFRNVETHGCSFWIKIKK